MRGTFHCTFASAAILVVLAWAAPIAEAQAAIRFDLPAQPLADSLRAVGNQTNINLLFDPPLVAAYTAPALKAQLTADQALSRLLVGTGIHHEFLNERTVVLAVAGAGTTSAFDQATESIMQTPSAPHAFNNSETLDPGAARKTGFWDRFRLAQNDTRQDSKNSATSNEGQPYAVGGLEEIIVTAQKREQSINDVGITMSVLTSQDLSQKNISDIAEVATSIPNIQVNYGSDLLSFNVRGIGANEFATNFDSPIAIHVDEAYLSKGFMAHSLLFDIDRVEALKGPQGTLFGRNATGGTINFFTRHPTDSFSAGASVSYDDYETVRGEAHVSGPLGGGLSARFSGMIVEQGQGFYRNLTLGGREKAERKAAGRTQIQWQGDATTALLSINYGRTRSSGVDAYEGVGVFTPESLAAGMPVFCAAYLMGRATGPIRIACAGPTAEIQATMIRTLRSTICGTRWTTAAAVRFCA